MPKKKKREKTFTSKPGEPRKQINFKTSISFHEPEDEQHCSTSYCDGAIILRPREFKQKLMIATNILVECRDEKEKILTSLKPPQAKIESILNKLNKFTNLPIDELKFINDSVITRDRSFSKALKDIKTIQCQTLGLIADDIRLILSNYILEKKNFPSKMDLLSSLKGQTSKYSNENIPIQRLIKNKLVKYQHFPELNRYILTEHPERVYERTLYLNRIKDFRSQGRNFVYVEVRRVTPRSTASGFIAGLAAFPSNGKLEKFFTKDSAELIAKKWLQQRILPLVEEDTIIVLVQPKKLNKLTPYGKRYDLIAWLDRHGIPYGKNPHTAELYDLYKAFKGKVRPTETYDHIFLNAGYSLVQCPSDWQSLNFFQLVWSDIEVMDGYQTGRPEALKQKILNSTELLTDLDKIEETLIEREYKMLQEDRKMEEIIENVLEIVKSGNVKVLEFPKECCGDKTDYFETHVCDYVLDVK